MLCRVNLNVDTDKAWEEESEHLIKGFAGICSQGVLFSVYFTIHCDVLLHWNKLRSSESSGISLHTSDFRRDLTLSFVDAV